MAVWRWLVPLLLVLSVAGCLNDFEDPIPPHQLRIAGIDVAAPRVSSGSVLLQVDVTLDVTEGDTPPVTVVVKAFDSATQLLVASTEASVGAIPKDRTQPVTLELEVPRQSSYRLEVVVYEADRIVQTGSMQLGNVAALERNLFDTGLRISEMDFLARNVSEGAVTIEAKIYVTNEGRDPSKALNLQVKAREITTGLLADDQSAGLESIGPEATQTASVRLTVPSGYNYQVEAVLWDGEFVVERGQGTVQLLPTFTKPKGEELIVSTPRIEDFVRGDRSRPEGSSASPAPGWILAIAAAAAALVATHRRTL